MKQNTRRTKIRSEHFAYISNENDQLKKWRTSSMRDKNHRTETIV